MRAHISPSLLAADFGSLGQEALNIERARADRLHFDVMDGHFVPYLSMGPECVKAVSALVSLPLDVHLMVASPSAVVESFAKSGATTISIHVEASDNIQDVLRFIKNLGCSPGLVINPDTPCDILLPYMGDVELITVMTVYPGACGQSFLTRRLEAVSTVRSYIEDIGRDILLQVDGGINSSTVSHVWEAGTDIVVSGSYVFGSDDYTKSIASLRPFVA